ncbi:acyltransferase [Akkermansiaceae bacterium]|nr:acyltransferase [Akkermansiaceae bacterium]
MKNEKGKFLAVEGIRGIACFMVVISHLSLTFFPFLHSFEIKADRELNPIQSFIHESPLGFFYSGTSAVYIFFVLSGFILTKVALKGSNVSIKILEMSIKRYPRLMLPALASCLIAFVVFQTTTISSPHLSDWINEYGSFPSSLTGAIHSGAVDVFFFSGRSSYNWVLWTMKIELIGSFVIFLLCLNRTVVKVPFFVLVVAAIISISIVTGFMDPRLGLGLISFLGGYLFCIFGREISGFAPFLLLLIGSIML